MNWLDNPSVLRQAARLCVAGAVLGMASSAITAALGGEIPRWTGNRQDYLSVGLAAFLICGAVFVASISLLRSSTLGGTIAVASLAIFAGQFGFILVGQIWLPSSWLLTFGGAIWAAHILKKPEVRRVIQEVWLGILVAFLAFAYILLGASSSGFILALGMGGGSLVLIGLLYAKKSRLCALAALLLGAVPFAAVTWDTLVTPLIAAQIILLGTMVVLNRDAGEAPGQPLSSARSAVRP